MYVVLIPRTSVGVVVALALLLTGCSSHQSLTECGKIVDVRIRDECIDRALEDPSVEECEIIYGLLPASRAGGECLHRAGVEVCYTSNLEPGLVYSYYAECLPGETPAEWIGD